MSDLENDSRAMAVGRKRKRAGEYPFPSSAADRAGEGEGSGSRRSSSKETTSRRSSLESGEISSAGEMRPPSPEWDNKYGRNFIPVNFSIPKRRLTESSHSSDLEETRRSTKIVSAMESSHANNTAPTPKPKQRAMSSSKPTLEGLRMCDISYQEVCQQELYFDLNVEEYPDDLVYCFCCGGRGHMASTCSKSTCEHCGAKEQHASYACPTYRKCRFCRQRGHDATECSNPVNKSNRDPCDICQKSGHVEQECPRLWSTSLEPDPDDKVRKIHDSKMTRACYKCGDNYHWGDDCPERDRTMPASLVKTWSKAFANQFVIKHDSKTLEDRSNFMEEKEQDKPKPNW